MNRYLYRAQYTYPDGFTPVDGETSSYEAICVRAETEAAAEAEVDTATSRYPALIGVTKTLTLVAVTAD